MLTLVVSHQVCLTLEEREAVRGGKVCRSGRRKCSGLAKRWLVV